jgi:DNA transformation protein and related proteins
MKRTEFLDYVLEQMVFVRGLRVRSMFGGYGVYQDELIFAIIVKDILYLKADAAIQADFNEKGLMPFTYSTRDKPVTLQYFEAPPDVFEEPETMRDWVEKAIGASLRQRSLSPVKKQFNNPDF